MATKTFTKENAGEYVPQAKDEFEWCGDTFVCGHNSVGAYQFAVLPYAIRSLTNEQWRDLLNAGLITIHREVPDEPVADHDYQRLLEYASVMSNYPLNSEDWASSVTRILTVLISKVKP